MTTPDGPWTVDEVAAYLRRSTETVRRMARRGELGGVKLGRDWRFDPAAVRALLTKAPAAKAPPEVAAIIEAQMHAAFARAVARGRGA
jgi:excisionase family DNA binding protein